MVPTVLTAITNNLAHIEGVGIVRPLYDRILVRRDKETDTFAGTNIQKAEAYAEKPLFGTVLAVGEGRILDTGQLLPLRIQKGERVMFGVHAGVNVPEEVAPDLMMMREDEVMAVVQPVAVEEPEAVPV